MSEQSKVRKSIKIFGILSIILFSIVLIYAVEYPQGIVETITLGVDTVGTKEIVEDFGSLGVDIGGTTEKIESISLGVTGILNITNVNLNLAVYAADGSTLITDLSDAYINLVNDTGTFSLAVSSGVLNLTGLTVNSLQNITVQTLNTTSSNSFVKVNSSDMVSINVIETMSRDLVLSVYQSVTWSFIKADDSAFLPDFLEVTFGNNGTKANVTSSSVFLNGSNTINRIFWQGGNVKNASTTFEVSSDSEVFVFEGQIYSVSYIFKRADDTTYSPDNLTIIAPNSTSIAITSFSNIYQQNGTWVPQSINVYNQNVRHNVSDTYSPSTDSLSLDYITKVYDFAIQGRGLTDTTLSGVTLDIILPNSTVLLSQAANSLGLKLLGYVGNGSLTVTGYYQGIVGNSSFVSSVSADGTLTLIMQVGKDSANNFRFIVGSDKFRLEELTSSYQVDPPWVLINSTYIDTGNHTGWAYDSATHVLTITDSSFETINTLHDISWNLGAVLLTFNATGSSSETLLKVSWEGVVQGGGVAPPAGDGGSASSNDNSVQSFSIHIVDTQYVAWIGESTSITVQIEWSSVTKIKVTEVEVLGAYSGWVTLVTPLPVFTSFSADGVKMFVSLSIDVPADVDPQLISLGLKVTAESLQGAESNIQESLKVDLSYKGMAVGSINPGDYTLFAVFGLLILLVGGSAFARVRKPGVKSNRNVSKENLS